MLSAAWFRENVGHQLKSACTMVVGLFWCCAFRLHLVRVTMWEVAHNLTGLGMLRPSSILLCQRVMAGTRVTLALTVL